MARGLKRPTHCSLSYHLERPWRLATTRMSDNHTHPRWLTSVSWAHRSDLEPLAASFARLSFVCVGTSRESPPRALHFSSLDEEPQPRLLDEDSLLLPRAS